ncbi:MAG: DUF4837 family protein [Cryomorphaceae bacterium]
MKRFEVSYFFLLIAALVLTQCAESDGKRRMPRHSGEPGEVLLVMNEKEWMSAPGDSLRNYLEAYVPLLPQAEPSFSILQFSSGELSEMLKHHRNIIEVVIGPDSEGQNKLTYKKDKWSNNQLVFSIKAESEDEFYQILRSELGKAISLINSKEIDRIQRKYKRVGNDELQKRVKEEYGIDMLFPRDCEVYKTADDFAWIKRERIKYKGNTAHDITQGIFVYRYPYTSNTLFEQESILSTRDSVLKAQVPGPKEGTYMTTEYLFEPQSEEITVGGKYAVLTRGLWKTENYFMGGPFMSLTTTSEDDSEVICISGFVFAPKFDKREYIREIEAILRSVKIAEAKIENS